LPVTTSQRVDLAELRSAFSARIHAPNDAGYDPARPLGTLPSTNTRYLWPKPAGVNAKGMPGLLDLATVWTETSEHAVLARPPAWIQHALIRALAPRARAAERRAPTCERTSREPSPSDPDERARPAVSLPR
jgi:hypothetical protein